MNAATTAVATPRRSRSAAERGGRLAPSWVVAAVDAALINAGFFVAWYLRYPLEFGREVAEQNYLPWSTYATIQLILTTVLLAVVRVQGLYRQRRGAGSVDELAIIVGGTTVGVAIMIVAVFYFRPFGLSRLIFVYAWVAIVVLLGLSRLVEATARAYLRRRGVGLTRILVIGAGRQGRLIMQNVVAQPELGYHIVGFIDDVHQGDIGRFQHLGEPRELPRLVSDLGVDEVIIALPSAEHTRVNELMDACRLLCVDFRLVPDLYELSMSQVDVNEMNGIPLIGLRETSLRGSRLVAKRALDVVGSLIAILLLSPLLLLVALLIWLESPGPIIIKQVRVGRGGREFDFLKFRSMRVGAEREVEDLQHLNEASGPIFKIRNDPRRTRVGRYIRRFSIDELPQLFNVLRGEMSLVGPRPPFPHEVVHYEDWQRRRLDVYPGITGLWQVSGRSNLTFDEQALLDIWYIDNWSLGLDMKILVRTVPAVVLGIGAY